LFSPGTPVSSTNTTIHHDITETHNKWSGAAYLVLFSLQINTFENFKQDTNTNSGHFMNKINK
jgi:hypothetical protein